MREALWTAAAKLPLLLCPIRPASEYLTRKSGSYAPYQTVWGYAAAVQKGKLLRAVYERFRRRAWAAGGERGGERGQRKGSGTFLCGKGRGKIRAWPECNGWMWGARFIMP